MEQIACGPSRPASSAPSCLHQHPVMTTHTHTHTPPYPNSKFSTTVNLSIISGCLWELTDYRDVGTIDQNWSRRKWWYSDSHLSYGIIFKWLESILNSSLSSCLISNSCRSPPCGKLRRRVYSFLCLGMRKVVLNRRRVIRYWHATKDAFGKLRDGPILVL